MVKNILAWLDLIQSGINLNYIPTLPTSPHTILIPRIHDNFISIKIIKILNNSCKTNKRVKTQLSENDHHFISLMVSL